MMKHIAIECESIEQDHWGIARIVREFLFTLARRTDLVTTFRFHLFFHQTVPAGPWLDNPLFVIHQLSAPRWIGKPGSFSLYYYLLLPLATWHQRFDLIIFPNYMLPFGVRGRTATLLTEDVHREMYNHDVPWRYRLAYRVFCNHAARASEAIIAISKSSASNLQKVFTISPERIFVCYPGIGSSGATDSNSGQIAWPTLVPPGRRFLLFAAQMFPRRHARELILAFQKIMTDEPDLDLVLIGPDRYQPKQITELIKSVNEPTGQPRIKHREFVPQGELDSLMTHAAAFIYVSSTEAFGFPPLEALARGTVPVVADTPVSHELLETAAVYVHDPKSVTELVSAIKQAAAQKHEVVNRFHWNGFADSMLSMIRQLTNS